MRSYKRTYYSILCILAAWLCCGCTKEADVFADAPTNTEAIRLNVHLSIDKNAIQGNMRATTEGYGATEQESVIKTLTLFISSVSAGKETAEAHQTITITNQDQLNNLKFKLDITKGTKRFYLGANMKDAQINAFTGDKSEYTIPETNLTTSYSNANQLMTIDENTGVGSDIMMTARITKNSIQDIEVTEGEIFIDRPVKMDRTISKVLLTCTESLTSGENYIQVENDNGWAQLANVRYMGNLFNRKLYLFPQTDETLKLSMDSNYEMSPFFQKDANGNYVIKDKEGYYKENFQYLDAYLKVYDLIDNTKCKPYHKAVKYDNKRLETTSTNRYTEGMYFTENRVYNDFENIPAMISYTMDETFAIVSRLVSTHLLIAVKFVPKTITIDAKGATDKFTATDENDALTHLSNQSEVLDGTKIDYIQGTFWHYKGQYFTLDGMKQYLVENPQINRSVMERYDGGWGFYFTFIDGKVNGGVIDHKTEKAWGLTRNHYYILNVKKLIPPGSSVPGNKVMMLPTERVEWIDKGGSDITVIP